MLFQSSGVSQTVIPRQCIHDADGTEINVSDGRTYIEVSDVTMTVEVE